MKSDFLIDSLADSAEPVRPMSVGQSRLMLGGAALFTVVAVLVLFGPRVDLAQGTASPVILMIAGLFALAAVASGWAATRLAQPAVGGSQHGALWTVGAIALLPAISLIEFLLGNLAPAEPEGVINCLTYGTLSSLVTLAVLTWRLKKGAPVLPERAGLYAGLAAGAVGAFAITLECNFDGLAHMTLGHVGVVATMAMIGRFGISRLIRW
ncbi:DUF1109 domain-containing protein [Sphingomicrobium flavum]|uniref:DUF1109 domain-containing protein n=1 Tax=Sphingomicrobium flavum TaxID=1229164 RepID=UPI0021AD63F3|nr:DUF1109 domain-containing protein [Sphingomicrobium flavum]